MCSRTGSASRLHRVSRLCVDVLIIAVSVAGFQASRDKAAVGDSQSLSSPLSVLDPAYHKGSDFLKLFAPGARATQYGCAILQAGAMELLNNCLSEWGMPWLRAISLVQACDWSISQLPCLWTIKEKRVVRAKNKCDLNHCTPCDVGIA
jgi:hypothetical protein